MLGHDVEVAQWGIDNPLRAIEEAVANYAHAHKMSNAIARLYAESGELVAMKTEMDEQFDALEQMCEYVKYMVEAVRRADPIPRENLEWELSKIEGK